MHLERASTAFSHDCSGADNNDFQPSKKGGKTQLSDIFMPIRAWMIDGCLRTGCPMIDNVDSPSVLSVLCLNLSTFSDSCLKVYIYV